MDDNEDMERLLGEHILMAAQCNDGKIKLAVSQGVGRVSKSVLLVPYGDCCSSCFIEDVDNIDALQDAKVTGVEELEINSRRNAEFEVTDTWGYRLHTDKGICTIGMRLEHNGYYGGRLLVKGLEPRENSKPKCRSLSYETWLQSRLRDPDEALAFLTACLKCDPDQPDQTEEMRREQFGLAIARINAAWWG